MVSRAFIRIEPIKMKKMRISIFILAGVLSISSISYSYAQDDFPQRIISLSPTITEELYLLGAQDKLIGCTIYCETPPAARGKEKVGTVKDFSLEKVVSLEPDIVFTTTLADNKSIEKLKNLGIEVIAFPTAKSFGQMCEQLLELGRIIGREQRAEELVAEAKNETDAIRERVGDLPKPKVFAQIGAKPLFAATRDYFVNDFIEFAGGINIARDLNSGFYSREKVLEANPDVILVVTMGIVGEQEKEIWEKYDVIKAVENNRIHILDSRRLCSPTPVSFVDTLEEMVRILHR